MLAPNPRTDAPLPPTRVAVNERSLREALGQFATGVTVVTAIDPHGAPVRLTVSSFNSVSLSPPLVLWSLGRASRALAAFQACSHYAVNVLSTSQLEMAMQFAARDVDRFAGVATTTGHTGVPLIDGTLATFECANRSQYPEGDHIIFVGEVLACHSDNQAGPLLYHRGKLLDNAGLGT